MKNKYLEKYGFDERECWDLSYTSRVWLYSHLKLYLESAGSVVNLGHCTDGNTILYNIPVLYRTDKKIFTEEKQWYEERIEEHTLKESIEICINYLRDYLINAEVISEKFEDSIRLDGESLEKVQCAIKIFAEIFPEIWW